MKNFFGKIILRLLFLSFIGFLNLNIVMPANAAQVTSTGLLLEYKFNGNFNDSSVNNRATTYTGVILNTDLKQSINYATFNNGKISTNLGWSTDEYGQYTISMWYKGTSGTYSMINGLFTTSGTNCTVFTNTFACGNIFDNNWHHIVLRKNGKYNRMYIDGKLVLDYQGIVGALNYNMVLGNLNGNILGYRIYNRELTSSEVVDLFLEYSYIQSSIDTYGNITPYSSWTQSYGTGSYSVSLYVQTLLSQRRNMYNVTSSSWNGSQTVYTGDYNPQTIFSTVVTDTGSLNLVLSSDYLCTSPYGSFDCSILKDEKKHNILIRKNSSNFDIYIDGNKLFTKPSIGTKGNIGSTLTTYNSSTNAKSQFLGEITNLFVYNYMSDSDVNTYLNLEGYISTSLASKLKGYYNNILTINFTGIQLADKKENVDYEYSYDNLNFTKISSGSLVEQTTSSGSLIYEYLLDVSGQPDGTGNLYFRTNKLGVTKFISKVTFVKESVYDITITEPNTNDETSKNISASFSRGTLTMSLTRGTTCNNTLVFEKYSNLTFNSTKDNGVRICYKGVDSTTGKEFYKLSSPIQGIVSSVVYFGQDIFDYYTSWKFSPNIRNNDSTFMMLGLLANGSVSTQNYTTTTTTSTNISSMVDINGDGLIDLLYIGQTADGLNKRSIMVNNGDYSFNTVYKCASKANSYYGDCAGNIDLGN